MALYLQDLKKDSNAFFTSRFTGDALSKQLAALSYIEKMATITATDISTWDFDNVFLTEDGSRLIEHKGTLNQRLARVGTSLNAGLPQELAENERTMLSSLKIVATRNKEARLGRFAQERLSNINNANDYTRNVQTYISRAYEAHKQEMDLRQRDVGEDLMVRLANICKSNFFKLHSVYDTTIYFNTKSPVTLYHKNPYAGIDIAVPMGFYSIELNVNTARISVQALKDTVPNAGGYFHPYVSASGSICWGNASQAATTMLSLGQWDDLFGLLHGLLTTYSPEATPYMDLAAFKGAYDLWKDPSKRAECATCRRPFTEDGEPSCECTECNHCGRLIHHDQRGRCPDCWCDHCEENSACEVCGDCDRHIDDCECERE